LHDVQGWLLWRFEPFIGEAKPRKVPYWVDGTRRHGEQGGPVDRARLSTFFAAREAAARMGYDGVGFAPLPDFGYTFLDFDNCVDVAGNMPAEIGSIVSRTYAEYSPSGKGIRAALKGDLGNHKSPTTPDDYGFETFSSSGFVTFTGNILPACDVLGHQDTIADVDDVTRALCERRFGARSQAVFDPEDFMAGREPRLGLTPSKMQALLAVLDPSMGREPWLRIGFALHHETEGDDTGFELWDEWSSDGDTYPGTEGLRHQWDSFKGGTGKHLTDHHALRHQDGQGGGLPRAGQSRGRDCQGRGDDGRAAEQERRALRPCADIRPVTRPTNAVADKGRAAESRAGRAVRRVGIWQDVRGSGSGILCRTRQRVARPAHGARACCDHRRRGRRRHRQAR